MRILKKFTSLAVLDRARVIAIGMLSLLLGATAVLLILDLPVRPLLVLAIAVSMVTCLLYAAGLLRRAQGPVAPTRPAPVVDDSTLTSSPAARLTARVARTESASALVAFGLATKSFWIRRVLTHRASEGLFSYENLAAYVAEYAKAPEPKAVRLLLRDFNTATLVELSRLMHGQHLVDDDAELSLAIVEYAIATSSFYRLPMHLQKYCAWRLLLAGKPAKALSVVERWHNPDDQGARLRADTLNPFFSQAVQSSEAVWLEAFNRDFSRQGLELATLNPEGETPFDRLNSAAPRVAGPLVSVIMTAFRPDHALLTSVRSVVAQSWQNWELLVCDDGSGPEFDIILREAEALDPRVRVLRSIENEGTYRRRNAGLNEAKGEYVTFHDSDDWAHPRRLELQAQFLLDNPDHVACLCDSLRVSENLAFSQLRGVAIRKAEISLFFRREPVLLRLGGYDWVRKGADSEFRLRFEAAFGRTVPLVCPGIPLFIVRYTATSLSAPDITPGFVHPSRLAYQSAYLLWHSEIASGAHDGRIPTYPSRAFPAPARLSGMAPEENRWHHLLVFDAGETSWSSDEEQELISFIKSLHGSTALLSVASLTPGVLPRRPLLRSVAQLLAEGTLVTAFVDEPGHADRVVVLRASDLQAAPSVPSRLTADSVVIAAGPHDREGETYDREEVENNATRLFGTTPSLVQRGPGEPWP